jgi:hypothetical protein
VIVELVGPDSSAGPSSGGRSCTRCVIRHLAAAGATGIGLSGVISSAGRTIRRPERGSVVV